MIFKINKCYPFNYIKYLNLEFFIEFSELNMTTIPVEKEFLEELVDLKLKYLNEEMEKILKKWEYDSPSKFLEDAKDGTIEEAENDAITLKHLIDQRETLLNMKKSWNSIEKANN